MAVKKEPVPPLFRRFRIYLLSMIPLAGFSVYLYGIRPLVMIAAAVVIAVLSDLLNALWRNRAYTGKDLSSILLTVTFVLMLSAAARYEIVVTGCIVTLLVKHAFGSYGSAVFQPAAFGFAVSAICWPEELFRYPGSFHEIAAGFQQSAVLYDPPGYTLKNGGIPLIDPLDLVLGDFPGPMGATFGVVLIAILILTIASKVNTWHIPFAFLATVAAYAFLFPRIPGTRLQSVAYEILSGVIIFGAVYIASDPVTSPVNPRAKLLFGFFLGVGTMLFNHFGVFQMGTCFAVLLVNPLSSFLDRKLTPKTPLSAAAAEEES